MGCFQLTQVMKIFRFLVLQALMQKFELLKAFFTQSIPNTSLSTAKSFNAFKAANILQRGYSSDRITAMQSTVSSTVTVAHAIASVEFDNRNLRELPVDKETRNFPRQVPNAIFSKCQPTPVESPELIACSTDALELLGLTISKNQETSSPSTLADQTKKIIEDYFSGNSLLPGSTTYAHVYCGHQFGNFAGQLGDGAAISLGQIVNGKDRWELQLKGAGLTPFSRTADGRKVLRSSVREFLCSEAMFHLHIPTTRAATLVTSSSTVARDPFYDGRVLDEKCTIVSRIAPNFFRFGSFEIFKGDGGRKGPSAGNEILKKQLLDHVLSYYPEISNSDLTDEEKYAAFYTVVTKKTAELVARWNTVGFVHGVLNTDNMSVMGLTIDYGPFAFEEHFDPDFTPNGSDGGGRYTYAFQAGMCKWNMKKFAESLSPLLPLSYSSEILNQHWDETYESVYSKIMHEKLGFLSLQPGDKELIEEYFSVLAQTRTDFTDSFVALTEYASGYTKDKEELLENLVSRAASPNELVAMLKRKMKIHRIGMQPDQIQQIWDLIQKNPRQVTEMFGGAPLEAITAEIEGEKRNLDRQMKAAQEINRLQNVTPKQKVTGDRIIWSNYLEKYHARLSIDWKDGTENRMKSSELMRESNPTFILRNWIAQDAIDAAEKGNYSEVNTVMLMLTKPFAEEFSTFRSADRESGKGEGQNAIMKRYTQTAPPGADGLICTCSS